MSRRTATRLTELTAARVPFVHATVVRAQVPTSARPGDEAIVLGDGSIEGFVGGQCAEGSVRTAALGALVDGRSVLLRVLPDGGATFPDSPGAQVVVNHCFSGGALEIFLEPKLPSPLLRIVGETPVADALVAIAEVLGYATVRSNAVTGVDQAAALLVASHGRDEEEPIRAALDAGVGYIALVASRRRGEAVLSAMGLDEAQRSRISTPAGLDIGARTAPEVALSILAEVVTAVRRAPGPPRPLAPADPPRTAIDPICGMTVTVVDDTPRRDVDGTTVWFCRPQCRDAYARTAGP